MAVVKFITQTKYNKVFYPPHQEVEVDDKDLDELIAIGAIVVPREGKPAAEEKPTADVPKEGTAEDRAEKKSTKKATIKAAEKKSK